MFEFNYIFSNKAPLYYNLQKFGFTKNDNKYNYKTKIVDNRFILFVTITKQRTSTHPTNKQIKNKLKTKTSICKLYQDTLTNKNCIKFTARDILNSNALGSNNLYKINIILKDTKFNKTFTSLSQIQEVCLQNKIKSECEFTLNLICEMCFTLNIFKGKHSNKIIQHISKSYNATPNYCYESDNNFDIAIFQNNTNFNTFAFLQLTTISKLLQNGKNELSLNENDILNKLNYNKNVEILNLKLPTEIIEELIDNKIFFYSPYSKNWVAILLSKAKINKVLPLIKESYNLVEESNDDASFEKENISFQYKNYIKLCNIIRTNTKKICLVK